MLEILIDSSLLTNGSPIKFFIRAELQDSPSIFAFSNEVSVNIECGSEQVTVSEPTFELPFQPRSLGVPIDQSVSSLGLGAMFQSSKSQCPVVRYELFTSSSLSTPWSDAAIQLLNGNDLATAALRVDRDNGFKKVLFLKASTSAGVFAYI
jgi:hypothetical protein